MANKKENKAKEVLKQKAENKEVIRFRDRVEVEITKDTKHFKKGYKMEIHPSMADIHVANGYAKIVK